MKHFSCGLKCHGRLEKKHVYNLLSSSKYLKSTKDCMHLSYLVFNLSFPYRAPIGDSTQTPLGWEFILTTVGFPPGPRSSESSALSYKLDPRQRQLHHRALQATSCSQRGSPAILAFSSGDRYCTDLLWKRLMEVKVTRKHTLSMFGKTLYRFRKSFQKVTRTPRGASRADPRGVVAGAVPPRCHPEAETMPGAQTRDDPSLRAAAANSGSYLAAPPSDLPHPAGTPARPRTPAAWDPRPAPGPPPGNLVRLADLSPLGDPRPAWDPCRLSPPPGLGPLSGPEPHPAPGPLPPEDPPRPAGTPAAWDPVRPRDLRPAVGPSPSPGTHVRRGPPPGPAPPPAASPQAASRAALTPCRRCPGRARRSRAARRAGVAATMEPRGGAASQPSQPVSRSGSGSVSRSARSSCRREVATGLRQRAGALAPPAPLRPAPGGARRSGPAPQPMERELSAEGGACRNKGRWG
ncbi:hypothetical protein DBR06_SOUSAS6010079, partial [Sousa chinensis]